MEEERERNEGGGEDEAEKAKREDEEDNVSPLRALFHFSTSSFTLVLVGKFFILFLSLWCWLGKFSLFITKFLY